MAGQPPVSPVRPDSRVSNGASGTRLTGRRVPASLRQGKKASFPFPLVHPPLTRRTAPSPSSTLSIISSRLRDRSILARSAQGRR